MRASSVWAIVAGILVSAVRCDDAIEATLSAVQQIKQVERLRKLEALAKSVLGDSGLNVKVSLCPGEGACLRASRPIGGDEPFLTISRDVVINRDVVKASGIGEHVPDSIGDEAAMAVYLLFIRNQPGMHADYVHSLPAENSCLTRYRTHELGEFEDPRIVASVGSFRAQQDQEYEDVVPPLIEALPDLAASMSRDAFAWARFMVSSRVLMIDGTKTMVPLLDLLNHRHTAPPISNSHSDQGNLRFSLPGGKGFQAEQQITMSYGPHSNLEMLLTYGFHSNKPNPYNNIELFGYSSLRKQPATWLSRCMQLVKPPTKLPPHLTQIRLELGDPVGAGCKSKDTRGCSTLELFPQLLHCANIASSPTSKKSAAPPDSEQHPHHPAFITRVLTEQPSKLQQAATAAAGALQRLIDTEYKTTLAQDKLALAAAKLKVDSRVKTAILYRISCKKSLERLLQSLREEAQVEAAPAPKRFWLTMRFPSAPEGLETALSAARSAGSAVAWQAVLGINPTSVEAWSSLGLLAQHQQDHLQAERCFREALKHSNNGDVLTEAKLHCNLAIALHNAGNTQDSLREYQQALQRDTSLEPCWDHYSNALQSLGRIKEASAARSRTLLKTEL